MEKSKLQFLECTNRALWEEFNTSSEYSSYFQSWDWGEVDEHSQTPILRIAIYKAKKLIGLMQIADITSKRGHFLYIRQGPVVLEWTQEVVSEIIAFVKKEARLKKASFIRMSPLIADTKENRMLFGKKGFFYSPTHNQDGENRWILPLDKTEDELLAGMRKTTRYMIRKAQNSNIKIERTNKLYKIKEFSKIYTETSETKNFVAHKSIAQEFEALAKSHNVYLYLAYEGATLLAGAFVARYGNEAIYRHGATSEDGRKSPASYLLQWEAIKDAKKADLVRYDFWGIAENENPKHPWHGLSLFKKGFGGEQLNFIHSIDIPVGPRYIFTYIIDFITTIKKGYGIPPRLLVQ